MKELFECPVVESPRLKRHREELQARRLWMLQTKEERRIFTHLCHGAGEWMAIPMDIACDALKGFNLTEEEKTCGISMMAGYCRLLDEGGILIDGQETELQAILGLAKQHGWQIPEFLDSEKGDGR